MKEYNYVLYLNISDFTHELLFLLLSLLFERDLCVRMPFEFK